MKLRDLVKIKPIEPVIFLGYFSNILQTFLFQSVTLDSARAMIEERNLHSNQTLAPHNSTKNFHESLVQNEAAKWTLYSNLSFGLVSFLISNFYGFLADRRGHGKCLFIILTGNMIVSLLLFIRLLISSSKHILLFILFAQTLSGFFGGPIVLMSMTTGFISEVSEKQENTGRFSILEGAGCLATVLGQGMGGKVIDNLRFYHTVILIAIPNTLSLIYVKVTQRKTSSSKRNKAQSYSDVSQTGGLGKFFYTVCRGSNMPHIILILMLNSIIILSISIMGANSLLYLYLRKSPVSFTNTEFGVYSACSQLLNGIGLLVILTQMKKVLINEMFLCCMSVFLRVITFIIIAFANSRAIVYLSLCLVILCGYESPIMRAVALRQVDPSDEGKLSGIIAAIQSLGFLLGLSVFPRIYMITLDYFPGTVFIACSVMVALTLTLHIAVLYLELKQNAKNGKIRLKNIVFSTQPCKVAKTASKNQGLLGSSDNE